MAASCHLVTDAPPELIRQAFRAQFHTRPNLRDRLALAKRAALRPRQVWKPAHIVDADLAARLVRGGLREVMAPTRRRPGSQLGTVIALSIDESTAGNEAELWLADHPTFTGITHMSDVVIAYTRGIARILQAQGAHVELQED